MKYLYKRLMKHLPKVLKKKFTPINATVPINDNLYEYFETSSPYHFQNLTNFEATKGLHTLYNIEQLIADRKKNIEKIYTIISNSDNLHLKPLLTYQNDYIYSRIPLLTENTSLQKWKTIFHKHGEFIDMDYQPLSNNTLIRQKCIILKNYSTSEYLSRRLLPLPVNPNVIKILKKHH